MDEYIAIESSFSKEEEGYSSTDDSLDLWIAKRSLKQSAQARHIFEYNKKTKVK